MSTNLPNLFDLFKFEKRKTPLQQDFEQANMLFLLAFKRIVETSFQNLHSKIFTMFKPYDMDKNMPAVATISFIRQEIIQNFPEYCRSATPARFRLVTPTNEYIYIKKLDDNYRPSNIQTGENDLIMNQLTVSKKDKGPNIFVGYTSTHGNSSLTGIYAVCIDGPNLIWRTDISDLSRDNQAPLVGIKPKGPEPTLKPGIVKIRKEKNE